MEEVEGPFAIDGVRAHEGFHFAPVTDPESGGVVEFHLPELPAHGLIRRHAVEMPALHHERPRCNASRHLGVVEGAAEIELEDLIFAAPDITVAAGRTRGGGVLAHPLVEVGRADRENVVRDQRRTGS